MPFKILPFILSDWRFLFFSLAFVFYALWGSPTPNTPDWVEGVIAVLLVSAVGFVPIFKAFTVEKNRKTPKWELAAKVFLIYGLSVPLVLSVIHGHSLHVVLRDVIAFIFVCLPLFFVTFIHGNQVREKAFFYLCLMVGIVFALRVLVPHFLLFRNTTELLYLANSPLVLMSALYFAGRGALSLYRKITFPSLIRALFYLSFMSLLMMAMFVDLQRASFIALVVSFMSLFIEGFIKAPIKTVFPAIIMIIAAATFADYILGIVANVEIKTSQVGLNMRAQELQAVWQSISQQPTTLFFGLGWGSSFASPAVGDLNVTYTHSFLTYMFLKMGLIGLFLSLIYLFFIFEKLCRLYCTDPVKGTALIWPFLIPIFLYASHKSFDFGVLLSLILVHTMSMKGKNES